MSNGDVECVVAEDTKECITKIMVQLFFPFSSHCELLFNIQVLESTGSVSFLHLSLAER